MKTKFHDRHEWRTYIKTLEIARRIVADPGLIESARAFVERAMAPDPHQRVYTEMWREMLDRPPEEIAAALIEDSGRGRLSRETSPVFGPGFMPSEVFALIARAEVPPPP